MSNASRNLVASDKHERVGPDYFGYYTCEVVNLLSQDEDDLSFATQTSELPQSNCGEGRKENLIHHSNNCSGPLYSNGIGAGLSDFKKDRLRLLFRQSVTALSSEVDEVLDPVLATYHLQSRLRSKAHSLNDKATASEDTVQVPCKKLKVSSSASLFAQNRDVNPHCNRKVSKDKCMDSEPLDMASSEKGKSNIQKSCTHSERNASALHKTDSAEQKDDDCQLGSNIGFEKENGEVNDDVHFLLENGSVEVEEIVKKYSDELSARLEYMEQQLELLLDAVMLKCRPMTLGEKQQLQKLIQKLPARNLDRVVEIICRSKPLAKEYCDKIFVDLENEDNTTLWRLHYYAEAVEKAKRLSCSQGA